MMSFSEGLEEKGPPCAGSGACEGGSVALMWRMYMVQRRAGCYASTAGTQAGPALLCMRPVCWHGGQAAAGLAEAPSPEAPQGARARLLRVECKRQQPVKSRLDESEAVSRPRQEEGRREVVPLGASAHVHGRAGRVGHLRERRQCHVWRLGCSRQPTSARRSDHAPGALLAAAWSQCQAHGITHTHHAKI